METTFTQATSVAKKLITTKNKFVMRSLILTMAIILCIGNAWASAYSYAAVMSDNTGQGLVYMKRQDSGTPSDPAQNEYRHYSPTAAVNGTSNYTDLGSHSSSMAKNAYFWAMPVRGYEWKEWRSEGAHV